ncbi:hypothetical protein EJV47_07145 [Hymenobacter gummosus]|uniref:receptor protein-tyrosine kinase n=1 Tax=Hymenobacter gummosus TaxID=1776032 RepID=A0A431U5X2_9BACT|nr:tail fiber domain-containing protein [Hymenobacter gummosus]RTQ51568.1 hypothetical protein EJV47_07145 [Hymenobacter gummosus]
MQQLLRRSVPLLAAALGLSLAARAQTPNAVGIGTTAPAASALLDLSSTTKGFLAPRMTAAERTAISSPARGLLVYQTDGLQLGFWYYTGAAWTYLNPTPAGDNLGSHLATTNLGLNGNWLSNAPGTANGLRVDNQGNVGVGVAAPQRPLDVGGPAVLRGRLTLGPQDGADPLANLTWNLDNLNGTLRMFRENNLGGGGGVVHLGVQGSTGNVGVGTDNPQARLHVVGAAGTPNVRLESLGGTGTRMVVTDAAGNLSSATLPTGGDNLGNHTATQNLNLADKQLVGNGGTQGLAISSGGSVGIGTTTPAASALLDVTSTAKGFLPPRMTQAQRDAIASPAAGLVIYNTSTNHLNFYDGTYWTETVASAQPAGLNLTDGNQGTWTVPPGVTSVQIDLAGSQGSSASTPNPNGNTIYSVGGKGGRVRATLTVVPGQTLSGTTGSISGASTVSVYNPGTSQWTLVAVAGGGGSAGRATASWGGTPPTAHGGPGGGLVGGQAPNISTPSGNEGAYGGTQSAGGAVIRRTYGDITQPAQPGSFGRGGEGGTSYSMTGFGNTYWYGGRGGDGYYGGGGANPLAGGGGGSSYTHPTLATNVLHDQGTQTGNGYVQITTVRTADQPVLDLSNSTIPQTDGAVLFATSGKLNGNATKLFWDNTANRLGLGTNTPAATLDVTGTTNLNGATTLAGPTTLNGTTSVGGSVGLNQNDLRLSAPTDGNHGLGYYGGSKTWSGGNVNGPVLFGFDGGRLGANQSGTQSTALSWAANGFVGIGPGMTTPNGPLEIRRDDADAYVVMHDPSNNWFSFGQHRADGNKIKISDGNAFGGTNYLTIARGSGNIGIGTTNPSAKLEVSGVGSIGNYNYAYYAYNGGVFNGVANNGTGSNVSIWAAGRVVAAEFNATSDRRLKNIIGLSDRAADLALLQRIRITDYTMRDRAEYQDRRFKKVIAQEVEEVFPQAVSQHRGFVPDIYAPATAAAAEGDSLLRLTLPAAPTAQAGQRVKLIGPAGEVIGTVQAVSGKTLVVRGVRQLAGQAVFVFGLEHPDVRSVDYEALAMLNVSATQELARKVAELEKQNAQLRQQNQAQGTQLTRLQTSVHELQTQAAQTTELAQRLKALENLLGAKADAR